MQNMGTLRFNFNKLQELMVRFVKKSQTTDCITAAVPELVAALLELIKSPDATSAQRMRGCELLVGCWARVLTNDQKSDRYDVQRLEANATRERARADKAQSLVKEKANRLAIDKEQKKLARSLRRFEAERDQKETGGGDANKD